MSIIQLHHMGEPIIAGLINYLIQNNKLQDFLDSDHVFVPNDVDQKIKIQKLGLVLKHLTNSSNAGTNAALNVKDHSFDKLHNIDVYIRTKDWCIPIEVKMGHSGNVVSWAKFIKNELIKRQITKHGDDKLKGSVSSILANLSKDGMKYEILAEIKDHPDSKPENYQLTPVWFLCVRHKFIDLYRNSKTENHIDTIHLPVVFSFEKILEYAFKGDGAAYDKFLDDIWISSKEDLKKPIKEFLSHD